MGFFDKVKKAFESKKDDVESQNSINDTVNDEPAHFEKSDDVDESSNKKEGIQAQNAERTIFKYDVFISYSEMDRHIADMICYFFEMNGLRCFDSRRWETSDNFSDGLIEAIKSSKIVLFIFSEYSNKSILSVNSIEYYSLNHHLNFASSYKKPIISVNIDETVPEEPVKSLFKDTYLLIEVSEEEFETLILGALKLCEEIESQSIGEYDVSEEIINKSRSQDNIKNFRYLDDLVHSEIKDIVLEYDIVLSPDEEFEYLEGINLDVNDLVIDGNGFTIHAKGKTKIFNCIGKNPLGNTKN